MDATVDSNLAYDTGNGRTQAPMTQEPSINAATLQAVVPSSEQLLGMGSSKQTVDESINDRDSKFTLSQFDKSKVAQKPLETVQEDVAEKKAAPAEEKNQSATKGKQKPKIKVNAVKVIDSRE